MAEAIEKVAVFGGTGNLGSTTVQALSATGRHKITVIARIGSSVKVPQGVDVVKGDLAAHDFLTKALEGQDAVVIALGLDAPDSLDKEIVTAASGAGVKYILPNEFVSQDCLRQHFPFGLHERKNEIRSLVESLGNSKWIAIVNGTWYDFSLSNGAYGIDLANRRAKIWSPGTVRANVTTVAKVGKSIAALLSLKKYQLAKYANSCVYISSFRVSQLDILRGVQRATGTETADWDISFENVHDAVQDGRRRADQGDLDGLIKVIYAMQFVPNSGGDYETTKGTSNMELNLDEEDFDAVTRSVLERT